MQGCLWRCYRGSEMRWSDVRVRHPGQWLVIEAMRAHTENHRRVFDEIEVVEVCPDGGTAFRRYRDLHRAHPERELCFVHTGSANLEIEERAWIGIRASDASHHPR